MLKNRGKKWSQDEIDYVRSFAEDPDGDTCLTVATYLGRTPASVRMRLHLLRQSGIRTNILTKWTTWEIKFLYKMHGKYSIQEQAEILGKSYSAVAHKRQELNLYVLPKYHSTPKKCDIEIRNLANQGLTRKEIADILGLSFDSCRKYINKNNIECSYDVEAQYKSRQYHRQIMDLIFKKEA